VCDWRNEDKFAEFQSRCDSIASIGASAPASPLPGRRWAPSSAGRSANWQSLSPTYKDVDLRVLAVADSVAFNVAVDDILKHADAEGRRPSRVPDGYLAERVETKGGHTSRGSTPPEKLDGRVHAHRQAGAQGEPLRLQQQRHGARLTPGSSALSGDRRGRPRGTARWVSVGSGSLDEGRHSKSG